MYNNDFYDNLREELRQESIASDYRENRCIICDHKFWDDDFKTVCDACCKEDYATDDFDFEEYLEEEYV